MGTHVFETTPEGDVYLGWLREVGMVKRKADPKDPDEFYTVEDLIGRPGPFVAIDGDGSETGGINRAAIGHDGAGNLILKEGVPRNPARARLLLEQTLLARVEALEAIVSAIDAGSPGLLTGDVKDILARMKVDIIPHATVKTGPDLDAAVAKLAAADEARDGGAIGSGQPGGGGD